MKIHMIAAIGKQGQLGLNSNIPWNNEDYAQEDRNLFRSFTMQKYCIVGPKTYETVRHLNGTIQRTIACFHPYQETIQQALTAHVVTAEGLGYTDIVVIGGAKTYEMLWPFIDGLKVISYVPYNGPADTYFPMQLLNEEIT